MAHDKGPFYLIEGSANGSVAFLCEHASQHLPQRWTWSDADLRLVDSHWAFDLGAAELTAELAASLHAPAVLAGFSRLLVDPNRPEDSDTLFRTHADGVPIELNRNVVEPDRTRRLRDYYTPYHAAANAMVRATAATTLFSVHSFTPVYEGERRDVEIGVLFEDDAEFAGRLQRALSDAAFGAQLNVPYSGKDGFAYSVVHHARAHGRRAVEIEVRQDLAVDPAFRARLVPVLSTFLGSAHG